MSNNDQSNNIAGYEMFFEANRPVVSTRLEPSDRRRTREQSVMNIIFRTVMEEMKNRELEELWSEDDLEEKYMEIAMQESLYHYKTQEKKPSVRLNIESNLATSDHKGEICSICISEIELDEKITPLECKHIFHTNCIGEWVMFKSECPCCREVIQTKILETNVLETNVLEV